MQQDSKQIIKGLPRRIALMLLDCAVPPGSWRRPRRPASILSRWFLRRERPPTACCKVRRS